MARSNAQAAKRMRKLRALRKNASRGLKHIDSVTEFSVTLASRTKAGRVSIDLEAMSRVSGFDLELAAMVDAIKTGRLVIRDRGEAKA